MTLPQGIFTISIDFELIWGTLDKPKWSRFVKLCLRERQQVVEALLDLFAEFGVSASWCTVGHLFLQGCSGDHPEIARTRGSAAQAVRFQRDPASSEQAAPVFYGRDLVARIQRCATRQEIGSHSFTHAIFPECSRETAASELAASRQAAERLGIELRSFVFPRNRVAHVDLLARHGFQVFRGRDACWYEQAVKRTLRHRLGHVWDIARAAAPPVVMPVAHADGLWEIPGSMLYTPSHGARRLVPKWLRVARARKGLDAAARQKRIFHLWFHPTDLAAQPEMMIQGLREILETASRLRAAGALNILPMGEITAWMKDSSRQPAMQAGDFS